MSAQPQLILAVAGLAYSGSAEIVHLVSCLLCQSMPVEIELVPAADVIEVAKQRNPALLIIGHRPLSQHAPAVLGTHLIKALKADRQTSHIPILLFESLLNIEHIARECGADAYARLPLETLEFVQMIERLIQPSHVLQPEPVLQP